MMDEPTQHPTDAASRTKDPSVFAQLNAGARHPTVDIDLAPMWTMTRGAMGLAPFAETVTNVRSGTASAQPTARFSEPVDSFLLDWLANRRSHHHDQHRDAHGVTHGVTHQIAHHMVVGVCDATRIWANKLLTEIGEANGTPISRLDFVHTSPQGGALSLNCLQLGDAGQDERMDVYCADVRERTSEVLKTVDALHLHCDFLIQLIGPMEPQSFEAVAERVRQLLQAPHRRLRMVLFVISPGAMRLRPALEALGAEMGDAVAAIQGNFVEMSQVWRAALASMGAFVEAHPIEVPAPEKLTEAQAYTAARTPADTRLDTRASRLNRQCQLLDALASAEGVRWAALFDHSGCVQGVASEVETEETVNSAVGAVVQLLRAEPAEPTDASAQHFCAETDRSVTLAQPLVHSPRWLIVQFDATQINNSLARLLADRMATELDSEEALT